jgi:hypothetical protein
MISDLRQYLRLPKAPEQPEILQQRVWQPPHPGPQTVSHQSPSMPRYEDHEDTDVILRAQEAESSDYSNSDDDFLRSEIAKCSDPESRSMLIYQRRASLRWRSQKKLMSEKIR